MRDTMLELGPAFVKIGQVLSTPALARIPARFDRTLYRLERGELVVRTEPVDERRVGDPDLGYAVVAGALVVAASILTFHGRPYELPVLAVAAAFLLAYLVRRRMS